MSAARTRNYRRVAQACDNCRRKKIRCPGERPQCSACARLLQHCSFTETDLVGEQSAGQLNAVVSSRLEQLEDKLDNLISRVAPQSMQETTPSSTSERHKRVPSFSAATPHTHISQPLSTPVSGDVGTRAFEFYFRHIHRQPLWLFDERPQDASEDLICAIMALFTTCHDSLRRGEGLESPDAYYKTARTSVMLAIAQGSMTIRNSQTLCLLAYYNFILGDSATAGFDISMAKNMIQFLPEDNSQRKSRIFWSIQFLGFTCGSPILLPSIPHTIDTPTFLVVEARDPLTGCISAPRASETGVQETLVDIWSESLKLCNIWTDVRIYVARCVEGQTKYPWHTDSDYARLYSQLLEVEMAWPISLSYNAVKLPSISVQEAKANRLDLLPWLRVQITYHAIHCVLNHPCLYTSMAETPKDKLGGNTFWRASYEKALRHCTWISRLIRTANEKGLELADPFFAQAAAIASTLHLYWTRTSDSRLKVSSMENLDLCRKLVKEMATCWPVCKAIDNALDHFIKSIDRPTQLASEGASPAAVKTSLIWILLDVAAPQFPNYRDRSVHSQTFWASSAGVGHEEGVSRSVTSTPPRDMRESTARYATPPPWMMERTQGASQVDMTQQRVDETLLVPSVVTNEHNPTYDLAWGAWENLGPMGESLYMNMDWWDMNQF